MLSTERNSFEKKVGKMNKSQSYSILHNKEGYAEDLYKIWQQRKGYLSIKMSKSCKYRSWITQ